MILVHLLPLLLTQTQLLLLSMYVSLKWDMVNYIMHNLWEYSDPLLETKELDQPQPLILV